MYMDPNIIKNDNVVEFSYPTSLKICEILIIDTQIVSKKDDTRPTLVYTITYENGFRRPPIGLTSMARMINLFFQLVVQSLLNACLSAIHSWSRTKTTYHSNVGVQCRIRHIYLSVHPQ